jgi:hypothetical protein
VVYEHGEPWWNYIDKRKLIRPPALSGNPISSHLVASQELAEEHDEFSLRSVFGENGGSYTMRNFIICIYPQISLGKSSQGE